MRRFTLYISAACLTFSVFIFTTAYLIQKGWDRVPTPIVKHAASPKPPPPPPPPPRSIEQCEHDYDSVHHVPVVPADYVSPRSRVIIYRLSGGFPSRHSRNTFLGFPIREKRVCDQQMSRNVIETLNSPLSYMDCSCFCDVMPLMALEIDGPGREPIKIWVDGDFHYIRLTDERQLDLSRRGYASIVSVYNQLFPGHAVKDKLE